MARPCRCRRALRSKPDGRISDWQYELWSNTTPRGRCRRPAPTCSRLYLAEPAKIGRRKAFRSRGGGDRNAVPLYDLPSKKIVNHFIPEMPIACRAAYARRLRQRVCGGVLHGRAAAAAGADPVAYRLKHMTDPRARAVIEAAALAAGWKAGAARVTGFTGAASASPSTRTSPAYVAVVAEVEVERASGRVRWRAPSRPPMRA